MNVIVRDSPFFSVKPLAGSIVIVIISVEGVIVTGVSLFDVMVIVPMCGVFTTPMLNGM